MEIRQASVADAKAIAALIHDTALQFITPELSPEATAYFLQANNEAAVAGFIQQGFIYFVAEHEDIAGVKLMGCIGMRNLSHIYHLFVAEVWQGQGFGRRLWQHAMAYCVERGNPDVFTVNSSNHAVAMYQALGFVATHPMQQLNGVRFNPMQLDLRSIVSL